MEEWERIMSRITYVKKWERRMRRIWRMREKDSEEWERRMRRMGRIRKNDKKDGKNEREWWEGWEE